MTDAKIAELAIKVAQPFEYIIDPSAVYTDEQLKHHSQLCALQSIENMKLLSRMDKRSINKLIQKLK